MKTINVDQLMLEITRHCNMSCSHCLRGPAQNLNITDEILIKTLKHIDCIGTLTFTGGEPSLNCHAIEFTLNYCKQHDIAVHGVYIVTNGKELPDKFLHLYLDWVLYVQSCNPWCYMETTGLSLSNDEFHEPISQQNVEKLKNFSTYRNDHDTTFSEHYLIKEGNAVELDESTHRFREPENKLKDILKQQEYYEEELQISESENSSTIDINQLFIYISADGKVKINCDDSYDNITNWIGSIQPDYGLYEVLEYFIKTINTKPQKKIQKTIQEECEVYKLKTNETEIKAVLTKYNNIVYTISYQKDGKIESKTLLAGTLQPSKETIQYQMHALMHMVKATE